MSADGLTAGKTADGLVDNCLENGSSQVFFGRAVIDQRLDIRFCKYAAAGRDRYKGTGNSLHIHSGRQHLSAAGKPSGR